MRKLLLVALCCTALAMPAAASATERIAPAADHAVEMTSTAAAMPRQATPIGALGDRPADGTLAIASHSLSIDANNTAYLVGHGLT